MGNLPATQIGFAIDIVDLKNGVAAGFGVQTLAVNTENLTKKLDPQGEGAATLLTTVPAGVPVSEIQQLVVNDPAKAGSMFDFVDEGTGNTHSGFEFTTARIQSGVDSLKGTGTAKVIEVSPNNWRITFSGAPGTDVKQLVVATDTSSQVAQDVPFGDLKNAGRNVFTQNVPGATGFTGVVQNMSNVTFGGGLNLLLGSNVSFVEAALAAANTTVTSPDKLFSDGSLSLGKNVFTVAGNSLAKLFGDERTGDGRYDGDSTALQDATKLLTDTLVSTAIDGSFTIGEPTVALGLHLMSGMTGGDRYVFEGFWGAAVIIEAPSITVGVDLNFGFDTLDFGNAGSDTIFDIYGVTTDNLDYWQSVVGAFGHPIPLSVGVNLVIARNLVATSLVNSFSTAGGGFAEGEFGLNFALATGIENIIGSGGNNTFNFHGTGRLDGVVSAGAGGDITFNYDDYSPANDYALDAIFNGVTYDGVVVDATAGINYEIIPSVNVPVLGELSSIGVDFGSATGVLGSRLAGLDLLIPNATGSFSPSNNAVNGILGIAGSTGSDYLIGNSNDNIFVLGQGGTDYIDGKGDDEIGDTVSFEKAENATDGMLIDLRTGDAYTRAPGGEASYVFSPGELAVVGNAGDLVLTYGGQSATLAAANVNAAGIQAAIEGLQGVGAGNITVTDRSPGVFDIAFHQADRSTVITTDASGFQLQVPGTVTYAQDTPAQRPEYAHGIWQRGRVHFDAWHRYRDDTGRRHCLTHSGQARRSHQYWCWQGYGRRRSRGRRVHHHV